MKSLRCILGQHSDQFFPLTPDEEKFLLDGWPVHRHSKCRRCGRVT